MIKPKSKETKPFYVVWNEARNEGAIFETMRDAESALDGQPWADPRIGYPSISTLAEQWFESCYGEDEGCFIEVIEL